MTTTTTPVEYTASIDKLTIDTRVGVPVESRGRIKIKVGNNVVTGFTNPLWRDQIARGNDASKPYSRRAWSIRPCHVSGMTRTLPTGFTASYKLFDSVSCQVLGESIPVNGSVDSTVAEQALLKVKNQLRQNSGQASVMAPIAESRELSGLVRNAAQYTSQFLEAYRDLRHGRTKKSRQFFYDLWLSYNFGINPMVGDISKASKAVASFLGRRDNVCPIRGSAHKVGNYFFYPTHSISPPLGCGVDARGAANYTLSYQYKGSFRSNVLSSNNYDVFDHLGLNLMSVPQTLWELTAFSWVADYFTNVGSYLEDTFYVPQGNLTYLTLSRKYELTVQNTFNYVLIPGNPNNVELLGSTAGVAHIVYSEFDRTVLGVLPHIGLRFKNADEIGMHSVSKILNLVSVLRP